MNICNVQGVDWDEMIPTMIWDYYKNGKRLPKHTSFQLVYAKQVVMPIEFVVPRFRNALSTNMTDDKPMEKILEDLMEMEEH